MYEVQRKRNKIVKYNITIIYDVHTVGRAIKYPEKTN